MTEPPWSSAVAALKEAAGALGVGERAENRREDLPVDGRYAVASSVADVLDGIISLLRATEGDNQSSVGDIRSDDGRAIVAPLVEPLSALATRARNLQYSSAPAPPATPPRPDHGEDEEL